MEVLSAELERRRRFKSAMEVLSAEFERRRRHLKSKTSF
jgi:hypothetical protein